jgi:uroporphyrinogen-III synthase
LIPKIIPPLSGLTVLVTRPAEQASVLCAQIGAAGGEAIAFPAIAIEPLQAPAATPCDLAVFVSVNAVQYGAHLVERSDAMRVAAIGRATAAALATAKLAADIVPDAGFDSEALLAHPQVNLPQGSRVLIVRGCGGREVLQETFVARGMVVETREVYRRNKPNVERAQIDALETRWAEPGIDVVTITSVETLNNLLELLSAQGRDLLQKTSLLVASRRIGEAAMQAGLQSNILVAASADDSSTVGALALWHTRARTRT